MVRIAPIALALALIGATSAAFVVSERLKLERSLVAAPDFTRQFSPVCDCPTNAAELALRLRRAQTVEAAIVDEGGRVVRTLERGRSLARGGHVFRWDGRDEEGGVVADGAYRLRLRLEEEGRTILVPTTVRVDTVPPRVALLRVRPRTLSPDGDGAQDRVRVRYRSSERGRAELLVDGEVAVRGRVRARGAAGLEWAGRRAGTLVAAGPHLLSVRVRDLAGNASPPTRAIPVELARPG